MEGALEFVYSILPIFAGAAVFAAMKWLDLSPHKLTIYLDTSDILMPDAKPAAEHFTESGYLRDEFIINGIYPSHVKNLPIRAFSMFGIVSSKMVNALPKLLKRYQRRQIRIIAKGDEILDRLLAFCPASGLLIAYMLDYNLEVMRL